MKLFSRYNQLLTFKDKPKITLLTDNLAQKKEAKFEMFNKNNINPQTAQMNKFKVTELELTYKKNKVINC
jgi:hypothetical protein